VLLKGVLDSLLSREVRLGQVSFPV
jgi:hypothetical protein